MKRSITALIASALFFSSSLSSANQASVTPDYLPTEKDERGLWMQMDELEREIKKSNFVIKDQALNDYVRGVFCKTVGQAECAPVRIYIMRTPYFNATMAPNGMMQVWSGLLLRIRDEAQLSAVLGHEYTHYKKKHSVQLFKKIKKNLAIGNFLGGLGLGGALGQMLLVSDIFANSREMETESDSESIPMMVNAGYDPMAASKIWEQLRAEMDATAVAREKKSRKDKNGGIFATHPPSLERVNNLRSLAQKQSSSQTATLNRSAYVKALGPLWPQIVDDQIKLNDFGATDFLLGSLAQEGWTADLNFARGELYRSRGRPEDLTQAVGFYTQAVADPQVPVEAWRGLGLAKLRSGDASGKEALKTYLKLKPDASDKAMMAMLAQ
jgi:beta-barrel assembly-enhancing protease